MKSLTKGFMDSFIRRYKHMESILKDYHRLARDLKLFEIDGGFDRFEYDEYDDSFTIYWSISWAYGGYDSGSYYIKKDILLGDWRTYLHEQSDWKLSAKIKADREKAEKREQDEKNLLKRLKEKYGE